VKGIARVDDGQVRGTATLFEGSVVETSAPTRFQMVSGALLGMDANSRARVHAGRLEIDRGTGAVSGAGFRVEALGMQLVPETAGQTLFHVEHGSLEVAPLSGAVQVLDSQGALLARVTAGESLSFDSPEQGGGAQGPTQDAEPNKTKKKRGGAAVGGGTASKAGRLGGMSTATKTALAITVIGGGVGLGVGVYQATKSN
jgi:hypothetical protein